MKRFIIYNIFIIAFILIGCIFSACSSEKNESAGTSDADLSSMDIVKTTVSYEELIKLLEDKPSLEELNNRIVLECVKKTFNCYYAVLKTDQGWVIIYFDKDEKFSNEQQIIISENTNKDIMDSLKIGMSLEEVRKADPDGDYSFIYFSWSGYPQVSYHYLADGNVYYISYDDSFCISDIYTFVL